jgi:hypothetical protein
MSPSDKGTATPQSAPNWVEEASTGFERGSGPWPRDRQFNAQRAVRWMALSQLARTGLHAIVSKTFGQYADRRETFAYLPASPDDPPPNDYFDHSLETVTAHGSPDEPYWFDYVADSGDGFRATFTVAERLAAEQVEVSMKQSSTSEPEKITLPRGRLLVMGGDEVYPLPTGDPEHDAYLDRLTGPYEAALPYLRFKGDADNTAVQHLYAIPGNHDWYDGLGSFMKRFCSGQWIGAWRTRQRRSYFALKLPHGWWVWGIDAAFEGPMDAPQLEYFKHIAKDCVGNEDQVILCTAYPRWVQPGPAGDRAYSLLRGFVRQTFPERPSAVRLMLSGDKHCYASYEPVVSTAPGRGCTKIIAGGGGAYLSGTQDLEEDVTLHEPTGRKEPTRRAEPVDYHLRLRWPSRGVAQGRLAWSAPLRVWRHWSVSVVIGLLYLLLAGILRIGAAKSTSFPAAIQRIGKLSWADGLEQVARESVRSYTFWVFGLFVLVLWAALSGIALAWQRGDKLLQPHAHWLWGLGHAAAHLAAAFLITVTALDVAYEIDQGTAESAIAYYAMVFVGGYVAGTLIYALYLSLAQHRKRSVWALFPLLAHEGWKNFLRIRVTEDDVTVFALGAEHVPKRTLKWDASAPVVNHAKCEWDLIERVEVKRVKTEHT